MKNMMLAALVLAAGTAQAKTATLKIAQVSCMPATAEQTVFSFTAKGTLSFEEVVDKNVQTATKGELDVTLQEGDAVNALGPVSVSGQTTTVPAGDLMAEKSYVSELNSKTIRLFMNGPAGLASSHIKIEGQDYYANCVITSSMDSAIEE